MTQTTDLFGFAAHMHHSQEDVVQPAQLTATTDEIALSPYPLYPMNRYVMLLFAWNRRAMMLCMVCKMKNESNVCMNDMNGRARQGGRIAEDC